MGKKVIDYYGGLPQDIEWTLASGSFYLLQSRPITGVEFTWEEDLETWPSIPQEKGRHLDPGGSGRVVDGCHHTLNVVNPLSLDICSRSNEL
jgi:hypothetical protein